MSKNAREALLIGFLLAALPAIGKAFLDINTLEIENAHVKEILLEIKEDIKFIKRNTKTK